MGRIEIRQPDVGAIQTGDRPYAECHIGTEMRV
jgi:hypothetical protein